jgi:hypothetical protein
MRNLSLSIATFFIVIYSSLTFADYVRPGGKPDVATDGLVVLKIHGTPGENSRFKSKYHIQVIFVQIDTSTYTKHYFTNDEEIIVKFPAGEWFLAGAYPSMMTVDFGVSDTEYKHEAALPIKPFTVEAGKVIYGGELIMSGLQYQKPFNGLNDDDIGYQFVDNFESAKENTKKALSKKKYRDYPEMEKGLVELIE